MVVRFIVMQRTRELGIRSALGSSRGAIVQLVIGRCLRISAVGLAAGVVLATVITRLLASRLHGVAPAEPAVWVAAAALLIIVALMACWLPARAAARLDPVVVLRAD